MTNFIRYNPSTGDVIDYGYMEPIYIQEEIDAGKPTLFASNVYDFNWRVDLATMQIVPKTPEEIAASQLPPPPITLPPPLPTAPEAPAASPPQGV